MSDTLLLADESVTMQRVVELTFAEQGLKIASVSDGQQAIDYITAYRPALALINVTLPKVSGFDVARFVRDHSEARLPVLLLAGAFDHLDEATVRESGAAGVLVKPFEPSVVIKRVKELLGLKSDPPAESRPSSDSGRLVTAEGGPVRVVPPPARMATTPSSGDGAWDRLREDSGLGRDAAPVEGPGHGGGYLDQLDAAFESLDAQLAGRPAAPGRGPTPLPAPTIPAALDPARRPSAQQPIADSAGLGAFHESVGTTPASSSSSFEAPLKPVLEVDDDWFAQKPAAEEPISGLTEFVVTRSSDSSTAAPTPATDEPSWVPRVASVRVTEAETPTVSGQEPASPPPPDQVSATFATPPRSPNDSSLSAPVPFAAADAFAMLWAQEQGEVVPTPPAAVPVPLELSVESLDMLAAKITDRVAAVIVGPLTDRLTQNLSGPLTNDLAARLAPRLADQLLDRLSDRLASGLAERVADLVAERVIDSALGDALRQTVNEVAERVVRAEIERISAAAQSRRSQ
jgi:CheY-like chemotaxis protein